MCMQSHAHIYILYKQIYTRVYAYVNKDELQISIDWLIGMIAGFPTSALLIPLIYTF